MKAKLKAIWRILRAKEWVYMTDNDTNGFNYDWSVMGALPKTATAFDYADMVLKRIAHLTAAMKITAGKIYKAYTDDVLPDWMKD